MIKKIEKVLDIWHKHFANEKHQYSEFEKSDIEYFVGCLLYNHFKFSKALDTMKTMDLSYDFIAECGNEYDEVMDIINSINSHDDFEALAFLQSFIAESKMKYSVDESYLLDRLKYHVDAMAVRYNSNINIQSVKFEAPKPKSPNPLDRI